jgi:hypothetical protein
MFERVRKIHMNRAQKRAQVKQRRKRQTSPDEWVADFTYRKPSETPKEPAIPGVTVRPIDPNFQDQVSKNRWHDLQELDEVINTIKLLSSGANFWSWARNWDCKYVDIRIDMRDGGFVLRDREGVRINLDQLKWQYKSIEDSNE